MVSDSGIASCLEAATGKELWQERLGGDYAASLLYAEGRVYCFGQDGKATVLKARGRLKFLRAINFRTASWLHRLWMAAR